MWTAIRLGCWENYNKLKIKGFLWDDFFRIIVGRAEGQPFFLAEGNSSKRHQQIKLCIFALYLTISIAIRY